MCTLDLVRERRGALPASPLPGETLSTETDSLRRLARLRWRMAIAVSSLVVAGYFGFVLLIAFFKPGMSVLSTEGLSVGVALGAAVIGGTWGTTWYYVRWSNQRIDAEIARLRNGAR